MINLSASLTSSSVLQINNTLLYSCSDISLLCQIDQISSDPIFLLTPALDSWKSGQHTNLICANYQCSAIFNLIQSSLSFPLNVKIVESNRYRRIVSSNEWVANGIEDLQRDFKSGNNAKAMILQASSNTFVTNSSACLNIIVLQARVSTNIEELLMNAGRVFVVIDICDENAVQSLHFIGKANKTLKLFKGANSLEMMLKIIKEDLGVVYQLLTTENLTFNELIQQNCILRGINNSYS